MDVFVALADENRRRLLAALQAAPMSVNELVAASGASQPTVSKQLKVLREAGFVSRRGSAQLRIYQLERQPFDELEAWLVPYQRLWTKHLDALERYLDSRTGDRHGEKTLQAQHARQGQRGTKRRTVDARLRARARTRAR
jgi:DNA-binding transcriptional ArsR family regulator